MYRHRFYGGADAVRYLDKWGTVCYVQRAMPGQNIHEKMAVYP